MTVTGFPTSSDIYLEVDGKKVAVVQSYAAKTSRSSRTVEAFGEDQPVATIPGPRSHLVELTRISPWLSASRTGRLSTPAASGAPSGKTAPWATWWWKR